MLAKHSMQNHKGTLALTATAALVAALAPAGVASALPASPPKGGTVTMVEPAVSTTIDPALNFVDVGGQDPPMLEAVYGPGLAYLNPTTGAVELGFLKSLSTKDNGHTWTLALKPGLKFSDGTAFNAAAIAYNIKRDATPATGSSLQADASQLAPKVLSATKLQITTTPPDAQFPTILANEFAFVGSPTAIKKEGSKFGAHPVGAGPFKVGQVVYGSSWSFVPNKNYSLFAPGQPYLSGVKIESESNTNQLISALKTGEANLANAENQNAANMMKGAGMKLVTEIQPGGFFLLMNNSTPPFNNILAREAVYDALSRKAIAAVWAPGNPLSTNLFPPNSPFYNAKNNWPAGNTTKAQQLFDKLASQGHPVSFKLLWPTSAQLGNVGAYVSGALSQYKNVTVKDDSEPTTAYQQEMQKSGYQMTGFGVGSYVPGVFETFGSKGTLNYAKFDDSKVDTAIAKLQSTTNAGTQKTEWGIIASEIKKNYPVVWTQDNVQGFAYNQNQVGGVALTEWDQVAFFGPMYHKG